MELCSHRARVESDNVICRIYRIIIELWRTVSSAYNVTYKVIVSLLDFSVLIYKLSNKVSILLRRHWWFPIQTAFFNQLHDLGQIAWPLGTTDIHRRVREATEVVQVGGFAHCLAHSDIW